MLKNLWETQVTYKHLRNLVGGILLICGIVWVINVNKNVQILFQNDVVIIRTLKRMVPNTTRI